MTTEPNEQLTAERALELAHFSTDSWSTEEIRAYLRAFAEQQATIAARDRTIEELRRELDGYKKALSAQRVVGGAMAMVIADTELQREGSGQ